MWYNNLLALLISPAEVTSRSITTLPMLSIGLMSVAHTSTEVSPSFTKYCISVNPTRYTVLANQRFFVELKLQLLGINSKLIMLTMSIITLNTY